MCRLYLGVPRGWSICNLWFAKIVPFFAFLITISSVFQLHTTLPCFREVHQTNIMECNHKYELAVVLTTECSHGTPLSLGTVVNDIWRWTVLLHVWANLWVFPCRLSTQQRFQYIVKAKEWKFMRKQLQERGRISVPSGFQRSNNYLSILWI